MMELTILVILAILSVCFVIAYKASRNPPTFGDEQLLSQHRRFLDDTLRSRSYIGATYLHHMEKGSPAGHELIRRGYDLDALLVEAREAERDGRSIDWDSCRRPVEDVEGSKGADEGRRSVR